ncbi:MAG: hypothetical protein R6U95_08475 [Bacteroidales bacterium]
MEEYSLVYNFFETGNTFGNGSYVFTIVGIIGLLYSIFKGKEKRVLKIVFFSIFSVFSIFWNVTVHGGHYSSYNKLEELYQNKQFKTVEGVVSNYTPMKIEGHGSRESFSVDSVHFSYSDYLAIDGYNNSCIKGGAICKNGQHVKIEYYQNFNLSLEESINSTVSNLVGNQILKLYIKTNK